MATLIKRPNSPYWIACFDVPQPDGSIRRLKKSTKAKNHSDAVIEAVRLEEALCDKLELPRDFTLEVRGGGPLVGGWSWGGAGVGSLPINH